MDLKESLKYVKLRESAISMILGAVVIIVSGILLVNYLSKRNSAEVQQINIGDENSAEVTGIPNSHTIAPGENLWTIAEKYYGSGFYWTEIARENGISNADAISEGQTIKLPVVSPSPLAQATGTISPTPDLTATPSQVQVATTTPLATITAEPTAVVTSTPTPTVFTETGQGAIATEARSHTVKTGETLWNIAENYYQSGYNWTDIAEANKLSNADIISSGQILMIPNVQAKTATTGTINRENAISENIYTVQTGDSLWTIAVRAYGDGFRWDDIATGNNISAPYIIHKGNNLSIPR